MSRGHIFKGLLQLSLLSTNFSLYSAMHAVDGTTGAGRGLFLDSASTLFFGGERSGSEELPEDNSSSVAT